MPQRPRRLPEGPHGKQQRLHIRGPRGVYSDLAGWRALMLRHPAGRVYRSPGLRRRFLGWPAWVTGAPSWKPPRCPYPADGLKEEPETRGQHPALEQRSRGANGLLIFHTNALTHLGSGGRGRGRERRGESACGEGRG